MVVWKGKVGWGGACCWPLDNTKVLLSHLSSRWMAFQRQKGHGLFASLERQQKKLFYLGILLGRVRRPVDKRKTNSKL